jgi:hypothetical protein
LLSPGSTVCSCSLAGCALAIQVAGIKYACSCSLPACALAILVAGIK